jgi:lactose/L-arabinose transport system permease protein
LRRQRRAGGQRAGTLAPALIISALTGACTPDYGVIMLSAILATLPTLIIFFVLPRQFVEGLVGSAK